MIRLVHCPEEHVRVGVVRPVAGVLYVHGCRRVVRQDPLRNVLERAAIKGVGPSLLGTNTVNSVVWKCCTVFRTETAVLEAEATSAKSSGSLGPACFWFRATIDVQATSSRRGSGHHPLDPPRLAEAAGGTIARFVATDASTVLVP